MSIDTHQAVRAIERHAVALAEIAPLDWSAEVVACPGWRVEDVVRHLCDTHWFWATIVEERLDAPPTDPHPATPSTDELVAHFLAGARRLVAVLGGADQAAAVWTWAPGQSDVAFVTRHQVQEIAVHHFDVAAAVGAACSLNPLVAADAVEEFLTFSVSSPADPFDPPPPPLAGGLALVASDVGEAWTVADAETPSTVTWERGVDEADPSLVGTASEILLWLYGRVELEASPEARVLGSRLRALAFTD